MSTPIATSAIVQQAFREMETRPPSSLMDDSEEALAALEQYANARDMVLEMHDWSCARRLYRLAAISLNTDPTWVPDPDLPHEFSLPTEVIVPRHVLGSVRWRRDENMIRADAPILLMRGTRRLENEGAMTATLRQSIALQLAVLLSRRFVSSRTKRRELLSDLADAIALAKTSDAHSASHERLDGRHSSAGDDWVAEVSK